jgi:peptide-methionine (S)-S-oxide reductase
MKILVIAIIGLSLTLVATTTVMAATNLEKATFAGGCFWCMEHPFDELPGVISVTSLYRVIKKSYHEEVGRRTGHAESVQIVYDPAK